jgi:hypothetical protein
MTLGRTEPQGGLETTPNLGCRVLFSRVNFILVFGSCAIYTLLVIVFFTIAFIIVGLLYTLENNLPVVNFVS